MYLCEHTSINKQYFWILLCNGINGRCFALQNVKPSATVYFQDIWKSQVIIAANTKANIVAKFVKNIVASTKANIEAKIVAKTVAKIVANIMASIVANIVAIIVAIIAATEVKWISTL